MAPPLNGANRDRDTDSPLVPRPLPSDSPLAGAIDAQEACPSR
jgi:hypothetical protein